MQKWQCRIAPSLGDGFAGHPNDVWGTRDYTGEEGSAVFFGLYGLPDFYALWRHKGKKAILWAGSDITHFLKGYWLDGVGELRLEPERLAEWIQKNCINYVENTVEQKELESLGISSEVVPSFLGNVLDYQPDPSVWNDKERKVYASVSGDNFEMYGWDVIERIAPRCNAIFFLYGSDNWKSKHSNVVVRGRVPKEVMNEEVSKMHCGLRPLEHDGFSEITAKSVLMGQYPITRIKYPKVDSYQSAAQLADLVNQLAKCDGPNTGARDYYVSHLNKYVFNTNNQEA